jgi:hypothetical protein
MDKNHFMRLLFILLLCCGTASGQSIYSGKDSSFIKFIGNLPSSEPFDTAYAYRKVNSPFVYIISDKDLYENFGFELSEKFMDFNFSDYHILGTFQCKQCLMYCHHDQGQKNCHRNSCNIEWVWMMRDNKKAFTEIPAIVMPGHSGDDLSSKLHSFIGDTIIKSVPDTNMRQWYTTGHGDCMAHFDYSLFSDKYHPVLLLREMNYWGGCRAGGSRDYTISFTMPPDILYHTKNTVLMKKTGY